jgi:hypothetical protein
LEVGELAVNLTDLALYTKTAAGEIVILCAGGPKAPLIGVIAHPVNAPSSSPVSFSVTAFATMGRSLSYQWQVLASGSTAWQSLTNGSGVAGATTATLTLTGLGAPRGSEGALYRVVMTAEGADSVTSKVAAIVAPGGA